MMLPSIIVFSVIVFNFILSQAQERIAEAGLEVNILDFPWTVRLILGRKGLCTGAIISKSIVLTAAHCVKGIKQDDIKVYYGASKMNSIEELNRVSSNFTVHPNYGHFQNDLALIQVSVDFVFNERVQPLELDNASWPVTDGSKNPRKCLAAGWGYLSLETKQRTSSLRAINVSGMHGSRGCDCLRSYQNTRLVCVKGDSVCSGDSGGSLICGKKGVAVAQAVFRKPLRCKLWFWTSKENTCNSQDGVSMFTFLCPALDWIREYVEEVPKKPASCLGVSLISLPPALYIVIVFFKVNVFAIYALLIFPLPWTDGEWTYPSGGAGCSL